MSKAILLIGHGVLNKASGASMFQHAALLKKQGVARFATAGFLNLCEPTFRQALGHCLSKGATNIMVQPYFLFDGYCVSTKLRQLVDEAQQHYPKISLSMTRPFGNHEVLADLVVKRIREQNFETIQNGSTAIVLMAHGSPLIETNQPIYQIAKRVEDKLELPVCVAYLECNKPSISEAIDKCIGQGTDRLFAVPYFLQSGRHVCSDLPQIIANCKQRHPNKTILLTKHLDYDVSLISVIVDCLI